MPHFKAFRSQIDAVPERHSVLHRKREHRALHCVDHLACYVRGKLRLVDGARWLACGGFPANRRSAEGLVAPSSSASGFARRCDHSMTLQRKPRQERQLWRSQEWI
jgi:hypothetical protein